MAEAKKKELNIYQKIAQIQSEIGKIHKDAKNPFHKSKYESLENILEVVTPLNAEHGLALVFNVEFVEGLGAVVKGTLTDGEEKIEGVCPLAADGKNMMQAYGSAMSYSRRYIIRNMYNLNTTDDDAEGAASRAKLTTVDNDKGPYIIPEGRYKGLELSKIKSSDLEAYIDSVETSLDESGGKAPEWFKNLKIQFKKKR